MAVAGAAAADVLRRLRRVDADQPPPSWEDLRWLREQWDGPFMLKGVMRVDDARRAADVGVTRDLGVQPRRQQPRRHAGDDPRAARRSPTRSATRSRSLLDGGIRRGSDVVKALALGARAVMIGRAYLWGLAANGQAGVENVLDILRSGIDSALLGLGRASVRELSPADLLIPDGFERRLGVSEELGAPAAWPVRLGCATCPELLGRVDIRLLIPLGATEQHGPHLPLSTDTLIASGVAEAVAANRDDVVVAPALPYGSSGEHAAFRGRSRSGRRRSRPPWSNSSAARRRSATSPCCRGTAAMPSRSLERSRGCAPRGGAVHLWEPHVDGGDAHAGRVETSLMLALAPELVRDERPVGATQPIDELLPRLREDGVAAVSPNGVLGDARGATAGDGQALIERFVAEIDALLESTSNGAAVG